jgi:hypothetical protein
MSFNQPPPNPYGQQPGPQPGYGYPQQGGVPPQPGQQPTNPYGQPPTNAPYGVPQQAPNPYGQQPGWGAQVPPPPPMKKSNAGKVIGILAAVVVVAGAGIAFAVMGGGGLSGGGYKLTTPDTVLSGQYSKDPEAAAKLNSKSPTSQGSDTGITNATSATGAWKSTKDELILAGAYGDVTDPKAAVDKLITAVTQGETSATQGVATTEQHPSGFDGDVMKCGTDGQGLAQVPFCVWGDSSTVAMVMWTPSVDPSNPTSLPTAPSLSDFAQTTAKLRNDVRVKQ